MATKRKKNASCMLAAAVTRLTIIREVVFWSLATSFHRFADFAQQSEWVNRNAKNHMTTGPSNNHALHSLLSKTSFQRCK